MVLQGFERLQDSLLLSTAILKDSNSRNRNVDMARIDYRTAFDGAPGYSNP